MQYLGGKSRLAKEIAAIVAPRGLWWEPFCGGLSVSVQLAKYGPGIVSDINPALIALYQAVRDGWQPPTSVSREEYEAAKKLPDSDPRKAFCGFGCSFGGKWFRGQAVDGSLHSHGAGSKPTARSAAMSATKALVRDIPLLGSCSLRCLSFFDVEPGAMPLDSLYCDPPYAGAERYSTGSERTHAGTTRFDHTAFWQRCQQWADRGTRVFVSEYACPVRADVAFEKPHTSTVCRDKKHAPTLERLFRVLPSSALAAAE